MRSTLAAALLSLLPPFVGLLAVPLVASPLFAQEGVPAPAGLVPEKVWYAPTAEDWAKPVPIRWQRTWDDAVRLSQQTKKPILVCVNMDGEIASEHYAGIRYRDPAVAKLFDDYVCVIASVYRHNPRDHDEQGRRIPCPRLGCVTCGEHMAMEPIVYEKFLDGKRISPRHIMVELDGSEVYDVFYTWDIESVFTTIEKGIAERKLKAPPVVKGDRSLQQRIGSPDSEDREAVEQEFAAADAAQKQRMLELAMQQGETVPLELLRQAAMGLDPALAQEARKGLLQTKDPLAIELIADTLQAPLGADERQQLVEALAGFGKSSTRARTLATAHRGLDASESALDADRWQQALGSQSYAAAAAMADPAATAARRDAERRARPDDPAALLGVAEASLLQALAQHDSGRTAERLHRLRIQDAERGLDQAVAAGAKGWRVEALRAAILEQRGQRDDARRLAVEVAPRLPAEAAPQLSFTVLRLFALARQEAIVRAVRDGQEWPANWMSDVHTTYGVLQQHPLCTDREVVDHYDFLEFFRSPEAAVVLDHGLSRFPGSAWLHDRLRAALLQQGGADGLEADYQRRLQQPEALPSLRWFAGFASLLAAEQHRKARAPERAMAAYGRGIAHFEVYRAATGDPAAHWLAMAHGGLARVRLQAGDLAGSWQDLQQVFALSPAAAAATDGLSITAMQTTEMLRARASETGDTQLVAAIDAARQQLPPEAFELPDYEQASRPNGGQGRRRR